jgi:uncharacterized cofD-like protein
LRDEFGILPTSDIRQALVALSDDTGDREIFRSLFAYRFHQGIGINGMTFGNLFMAALADILGSQIKAIEKTKEILHIKGEILPVSLDDVHLVARYENGHQVVGEHYIDEPKHDGRLKIVELETIPKARAYPKAVKAIKGADLVVIGPGDLYTSIVCNLIIDGIPQALQKTKAKVVYIINLMGRYGQSYRFTVKDHLRVMEKYLRKGTLDYLIINNNSRIPKEVLDKYEEEQSFLVKNDLGNPAAAEPKVIKTDLLSAVIYKPAKGDRLQRSMIRHDPQKLAKTIVSILPHQ